MGKVKRLRDDERHRKAEAPPVHRESLADVLADVKRYLRAESDGYHDSVAAEDLLRRWRKAERT